jgi:hypothetical protein
MSYPLFIGMEETPSRRKKFERDVWFVRMFVAKNFRKAEKALAGNSEAIIKGFGLYRPCPFIPILPWLA